MISGNTLIYENTWSIKHFLQSILSKGIFPMYSWFQFQPTMLVLFKRINQRIPSKEIVRLALVDSFLCLSADLDHKSPYLKNCKRKNLQHHSNFNFCDPYFLLALLSTYYMFWSENTVQNKTYNFKVISKFPNNKVFDYLFELKDENWKSQNWNGIFKN